MGRLRSPERGLRALLSVMASALLAVAGPAVAADEVVTPAGGGVLRIAADPPRIVLGQDGGTELAIAAPPEVEELTVSTSAGRIEGLRRLPTGGFVARLRAPAERFPQIAIVAAVARGASGALLDGWLAIPLFGQGDAKVRSAPGSKITLRIGERTFGPRAADASGLAVIPVVVPPGVREAHHGFRPIDLNVPETPLLLAVADRTVVAADQQEQVRLLVYVVAPHGAARRGDVPVFEATRGWVTVAAREPGAYEAIWRLPPGPVGEERVVVRLPGSAPSRGTLRLTTVAGAPTTVAIAFDREALVADDAREVTITARVLDAAGNQTAAARVDLDADVGELSPAVERAPGVYDARLRVSPRFAGRKEVVVTARAEGSGVAGSRPLPLRSGAPTQARLEDRVVVADGAREAALRIEVLDQFDNRVERTPIVTAAFGHVLDVAPSGDGAGYALRYVGPAVEGRADDVLQIDVGTVRVEGRIGLIPPRARTGLFVAAGVAAGGSRGASGRTAQLVLERDAATRRGFDLAWRVEAAALATRGEGGGPLGAHPIAADAPVTAGATALLGGLSARRDLRGGPTTWASLTAGLLVGRVRADGALESGAAPAARLALGFGLRQRLGMPFVEVGLLAAGGRAADPLPLFTISTGVRFDLEASHADHPDRR
jgi:hypothetical protein